MTVRTTTNMTAANQMEVNVEENIIRSHNKIF